jgi:hypothetical protein
MNGDAGQRGTSSPLLTMTAAIADGGRGDHYFEFASGLPLFKALRGRPIKLSGSPRRSALNERNQMLQIQVMVNAELDAEQINELSQRLHETATRFAEERGLGDETMINVDSGIEDRAEIGADSMDKDFDQILEEFDQAAEAVYEHPECPEEIAKQTLAFLIALHTAMAKIHKREADRLRADAIGKFGNQAAVILDNQ